MKLYSFTVNRNIVELWDITQNMGAVYFVLHLYLTFNDCVFFSLLTVNS
jgi:hypothetical protein